MIKQKINTPGLYPSDNIVKVIPTTQPHGIYFALRYLYADDKDVNDWFFKQKNKDMLDGWKDVPSDYNPWQTASIK